ncbi:MAG: sulfur carrier protein ThiS [Planctomycetales bacterium]|nr:sulfur carrier protein ThiS [Planctomycetales bacterium]
MTVESPPFCPILASNGFAPVDITLNGHAHQADDEATVADLLRQLEMRPHLVAVEVNRQLVPRQQHADHQLRAGDQLEIVTLVGGG